MSCAIAVVLFWPQLFSLSQLNVIAQVISFRTALGLGALAIAVIGAVSCLMSRSGRRALLGATVVWAVFAALTLGMMALRGFGGALPEAKSGDDVRVLVWNTRGDQPGSPTIADLAASEEADIVVLPETTEEMGVEIATAMRERGLPMWVHSVSFNDDYKALSTTLLVSARLGDYEVLETTEATSTMPSIVAGPVDGRGPRIVAAHPEAPRPASVVKWRSDLQWLAGQCGAEANTIVAGDLNATVDHLSQFVAKDASARDTVVGHCVDAALAGGAGAMGTWPYNVPAQLAAPIDHVLATPDWRVVGTRVLTDVDHAGSDHRPIVAQLHHVDDNER